MQITMADGHCRMLFWGMGAPDPQSSTLASASKAVMVRQLRAVALTPRILSKAPAMRDRPKPLGA